LVPTDTITVDSDAGTLAFITVYKSDEGNYTCTAVNDAGNDSHTAHLLVRGMSTAYIYILYFARMQHTVTQYTNMQFFMKQHE